MGRNTTITLGDHFSKFVEDRITAGRFETVSEAVRAGLRLLEAEEAKVELLRERLARGVSQAVNGETVAGEPFMEEMLSKYGD